MNKALRHIDLWLGRHRGRDADRYREQDWWWLKEQLEDHGSDRVRIRLTESTKGLSLVVVKDDEGIEASELADCFVE